MSDDPYPPTVAGKEMYENQQVRKQRLYQWLKDTNSAVTEKEVASASSEVVRQYSCNTLGMLGLAATNSSYCGY